MVTAGKPCQLSENESADFIIIGSGIAGLYTAIRLAEHGRVTVLSKQELIAGNTWFAQGGIAAAFSPEDSPTHHFNDTWQAGVCFGDRLAISALVEEAPARINDLLELGVKFDSEKGVIALGREGAHSRKRILHIGGDATGRELIEALLLAATDRGVRFIEDAFVEHLLVKDGCCYGLIYSKEGKLRSFSTGVVILAAGGCGQLFQYTTNAPAVTGDGLALAYRAGAVLRDLEFFQFHPTVFLPPQGQPFLISEAVRGEGAYLVNSDGERFMERYHERAELGPRDIVSRAIVAECRQSGGQVYLDLRHLGADFVAGRFPTIHKRCLEWGLDVTRQLVPVTPAAHYLIGGIAVDLDGHTAVKNLFGVGEIASTGVHGANRLASNSLLEGLVFGHRVAEAAVKANSFIGNINGRQFLDVDFIRPTAAAEKTCAGLRPRLQQLMWEKVGLIRSEEGLLAMKKQLMEWLPLLAFQYYQPELLENRNMLLGACMMTEASLLRRESRGCHYRDDYPNYDHNMSGRHISFQLTDHTVVQSADYPRAFIHSGSA